ncbi:MAG: 50S ribosomal protein L24 [Candidatus Woesearchaeota archaeon]
MTTQSFSINWKKSTQPRKQRKYVYNAPSHIRGTFLSASLSKDLKQKYGKNAIRVRKGDKVKVMVGQHKGKIGVVERVNVQTSNVYIQKVDSVKKDGSKYLYPIHASNVQILDVKLKDKKREASLKRGNKND